MVLLGAPGSGKTTLLNYFAVIGTASNGEVMPYESFEECNSKAITHLKTETCLPIIIRIRDLALNPELSILEYVQTSTVRDLSISDNLTGFFEYYLENGNSLILLDGLDEVADVAQRYKIVEKIEAFLNQFQQCPAIITCRPAGYRRDFFRTDEYPHYELQLFDDDKIDTFIEHWYDSRVELLSERERRKASLRKALKEQPRIKQLTRNPLLLTIVALIHRYQAKLPKERHKLYDKAVETLLTTWDSNKELSNHEILEYLELDDLRRLMERLAYWIHCQGGTGDREGGTLIDRDELLAQLTQYIREMKHLERHQAGAEAKRFLEQIVRDRAGLLSLQGQDRYAFVHKTFQEYLTAMEIRDRQEEGFEVVLEHIEEHLHDPHWEEVLLLLVAQQRRNNPAKLLKAILAHDTPHERWLHRNLLFAGKVLAENVPVSESDLANTVLSRLMKLEVSQSPLVSNRLRHQILGIFGSLCETDFERAALAQIEIHKDCLDQWRFLEYQDELAPEKAAATLLALVKDENPEIQLRAANMLRKQTQYLDTSILVLLELSKLTSLSYRDRTQLFHILQEIGRVPEAFIKDLVNQLKGEDVNLYIETLNLLGRANGSSETVAKALAELVKNENPKVRARGANSFGVLKKTGSNTVIEALIGLLQDNEAEVRAQAAEALGRTGQASDAVIEALINLLQDNEAEVRAQAAETLGRMGQASDAVIEALINLLQDNEAEVRAQAAQALGRMGQASDAVIEALINLLQDNEAEVRAQAAEALGRMGQALDAVIETLIESLEDRRDVNLLHSLRVLGKLGKNSDSLAKTLIAKLNDETLSVTAYGDLVYVLGEMEQTSNTVFQSLEKQLNHRNSDIRFNAVEALGKLNSFPGSVIDSLKNLLEDENSSVNFLSAYILGQMGDDSTAVVDILLDSLKFDDFEFAIKSDLGIMFRNRRFMAQEALVLLGKSSCNITLHCSQWIDKYNNESFVCNGVDLLWKLVS